MMENVRISFLFLTLFVAATAALADEPPQVLENANAALQQNLFSLRRVPRECQGVAPHEMCWEIYPTAWQSYNKQKKGISLIINKWESDVVRNTTATDLRLTFVIDDKVTDLKKVHFQSGTHSFDGVTTTLNDEQLVRSIADGAQVWLGAGSEAWYATHLDPQMRLKLTPEMMASIEAVLNKYDSLDSPQSRLEKANAKTLGSLNEQLSGLTEELQVTVKEWRTVRVRDQGCNAASCLNQDKAAATAVLQCGESIGKLLDEKIALLGTQPQDAVVLKEESESLDNRDRVRTMVNNSKAVLAVIDKKLAQAKTSGSSGP